MRLATMSDGERSIVAIERDDQSYNWPDVIAGDLPHLILEAITSRKIFTEQLAFEGARPLGSEYKVLAPFPRPQGLDFRHSHNHRDLIQRFHSAGGGYHRHRYSGRCGPGFNPPRFLQHGSVMEAQIDNIGTLRNRIEFSGTDVSSP